MSPFVSERTIEQAQPRKNIYLARSPYRDDARRKHGPSPATSPSIPVRKGVTLGARGLRRHGDHAAAHKDSTWSKTKVQGYLQAAQINQQEHKCVHPIKQKKTRMYNGIEGEKRQTEGRERGQGTGEATISTARAEPSRSEGAHS